MGIPLLDSDLEAKDVVAKTDSSALSVGTDNLVTLVYGGQQTEVTAGDIFKLENIESNLGSIPVNTSSTGRDLSAPVASGPGMNLSEMTMSDGVFEVSFSGTGTAQGTLTVTLKTIGDPIVLNFGSISGSQLQSEALTGKTLDLSNNEIQINVTPNVTSGDGALEAFTVKMINPKYSEIKGDFGNTVFKLPKDSTRINLFKNVTEKGNFVVEDPRLMLRIDNDMGIPFGLRLDSTYGYIPFTGDKIDFGNNNLDIEIQRDKSGQVIQIDKSNSNITAFIQPTPSYMVFEPLMRANPAGVPSEENILRFNDRCAFSTELQLPLTGRVLEFFVIDTVPVGLGETLEQVKDFSIKSKIVNGFPMDATIDVELLDAGYRPLKVDGEGKKVPVRIIEAQTLCRSGLVDFDGIVYGSTESQQDYEVDESEIPFLKEADYAVITAKMATSNSGTELVKILSTYRLRVLMGIKVEGNIKLTQ